LDQPNVKLNVVDGSKRNLLHIACKKGWFAPTHPMHNVVALLQVVDCNQADVDGERPISVAATKDDITAMRALRALGEWRKCKLNVLCRLLTRNEIYRSANHTHSFG
jgi:hypothetical protein